jgi:hypothetical protein
MGYEEGEREDKSAVADEIRREWIKEEKPERAAKGGPRPG